MRGLAFGLGPSVVPEREKSLRTQYLLGRVETTPTTTGRGPVTVHELRLLNPDGYLALHPQARTVVPAEETAATTRHLLTVVAPADAAAPYNQGAGYTAYAYRVQTTPLPEG